MQLRFPLGLPEYECYAWADDTDADSNATNRDFRLAITANVILFLLSQEGQSVATQARCRYEQTAAAVGIPSLGQALESVRPAPLSSARVNALGPAGNDTGSGSCIVGAAAGLSVFPFESGDESLREKSMDATDRWQRLSAETDGYMQRCRVFMDTIDEISVPVEHTLLVRSPTMSTFADAVIENPEESLNCLGLAIVQVVKIHAWVRADHLHALGSCPQQYLDLIGEHLAAVRLPRAVVRLQGLRDQTDFSELRAHAVGRLVGIRGTVIRMSSIRPQLSSISVACATCGKSQRVTCPNFQYNPPPHCMASAECKSRVFLPDRCSAVTLDWQRIRLQELSSVGNVADVGGIPRTVECELTYADMLDTVVPGDIVDVVGIVRFLSLDADASRARRGRDHALYQVYLEVISLTPTNDAKEGEQRELAADAKTFEAAAPDLATEQDGGQTSQSLRSKGTMVRPAGIGGSRPHADSFTDEDLRCIRGILEHRGHVFEFLVQSLCPLICGHDIIKAALLLGILGGSNRGGTRPVPAIDNVGPAGISMLDSDILSALHASDASEHQQSLEHSVARSDIHVLVVGDPGVGKSQMLRAAAALLPRSVYVCGNTTTNSGLTVTVSRESGSGEYVLEAGALVLADRGICCIDEFDKMSADYQVLLEAMEQQSISVAKAGIVGTLAARASILAAANPIGGHYDKRRTVCENLKMCPALLSRFDLVFVIQDQPDRCRDQRISEHVMATFGGRRQRAAPMRWSLSTESSDGSSPPATDNKAGECSVGVSLWQRLQQSRKWAQKPASTRDLRTYVAFARRFIHPVLSVEAKQILRDFYLLMRRNAHALAGVHGHEALPPVTTRQLESLKRLAQARARAELRSVVSAQDARDVIEIMQCSMLDVYSDERGVLDFSRVGGTSRANDVRRFLLVLHQEANRRQNALFHLDELRQIAQQHHIEHGTDFSQFIDMLNLQGFLLQRSYRTYRLQGNDFAGVATDTGSRRRS